MLTLIVLYQIFELTSHVLWDMQILKLHVLLDIMVLISHVIVFFGQGLLCILILVLHVQSEVKNLCLPDLIKYQKVVFVYIFSHRFQCLLCLLVQAFWSLVSRLLHLLG